MHEEFYDSLVHGQEVIPDLGVQPQIGTYQSVDLSSYLGGDVTPERVEAINRMHEKYLHVFGQLGELLNDRPYSKIYLDDTLYASGALGVTVCGSSSCVPSVQGELYDKIPENLREEYLQLQPMLHELTHKKTLEDEMTNRAMETLSEMGYSRNNIIGFAEILAEKMPIEAMARAGEFELASVAAELSPYKESLKAGYKIANFFEYETDKKTYHGIEGFIEALADKALDLTTVNEYLRGVEVKPCGECEKCGKYSRDMMYA